MQTRLKALMKTDKTPSAWVPEKLCEGEMIHQSALLLRSIRREKNIILPTLLCVWESLIAVSASPVFLRWGQFCPYFQPPRGYFMSSGDILVVTRGGGEVSTTGI